MARIEKMLVQESGANILMRYMLNGHTWLEPLPEMAVAPHYLSVACCARNEGPYLREWLEYHRLVGGGAFLFL